MLTSTNTTTTTNTTDYSSSSSSTSPIIHHNSMEQLWNNININPNHTINNNININDNININNNIIHQPRATTNNYRGMILQDFLNSNNPSSITAVDHHHHHHHHHDDHDHQRTALKLTNEFHQLFDSNNTNNNNNSNNTNNNYSAFDLLASSSVLANFGGGDAVVRKRSWEFTPENVTVDRRHKRMIKNRESAARSRARKQAYITELELEVAHLAAENTRLRKQQQQLLEAPSNQVPKKKGLHRTLTAPF